MRGHLFFAFVALLLSTKAHAIKGAYLGDREFPANVCKIGFFAGSPSRDADQICTGTLIAKNRVLTAAHCDTNLDQHPNAYVRCGADAGLAGWNFATQVKGHIRAPWYSPDTKMHDLAVFELDSDLSPAPAPLVESYQQSKDVQENLGSCRVFGFGRDEFNRVGISHGVQFQSNPAQAGTHPYSIATGPNRAAPGDSGGPVLCPVNGTWTQLAVTVSIPADHASLVSFHELLEVHLEWLRGVQTLAHLPKVERQR